MKRRRPCEEAAALLFGLARAQAAAVETHQLWEAFATLRRAFEYYAESGNVALAVTAAEFPIAPTAYRMPGAAELMVRALALVPPDSHEAGRLLSRYGGILGAADDYEGAQEALARAIAIARREGDLPLEVHPADNSAIGEGLYLQRQVALTPGDGNRARQGLLSTFVVIRSPKDPTVTGEETPCLVGIRRDQSKSANHKVGNT